MSKKEQELVYPQVRVSVRGSEAETGVGDDLANQIRKALAKVAPDLIDFRGPTTADEMKEILGWVEEVEGGEVFEEGTYHLRDRYGKKIRLTKNPHNRPFYQSHCDAIVQEHLNKRYRFNGENMIVGCYGNINDGQHTGAALVLADQDVQRDPEKWVHNWPGGRVTMSRLIVFGVSEDDDVVNTINTGKSRSLSDVIFRTDLFKKMGKTRRAVASTVLDYAVKRLWTRTGVYRSTEAPRKTHSEALDFVDRHPRLLNCVKFVMGEEPKRGPKKRDEGEKTATIKDFVPLGYAAAMLYLMSASKTSFDHYHKEGVTRGDRRIDFSAARTAEEFWVDLVKSPKLQAVRDAIAELHETPGGWGRLAEKDYVIVAAWNLYSKGKRVTAADVEVKYTKPNAKGRVWPRDVPIVCDGDGENLLGIDVGDDGSKGEPNAAERKAIEARKKDVEQQKADKNGHTDPLDKIRRRYRSADVVLAKATGGDNYFLWDGDAEKAAPHLRTEARPHPTGKLHIPVRGDEVEGCVKTLNEAGLTVARVVSMRDDEDWVVEVTKGSKAKGG